MDILLLKNEFINAAIAHELATVNGESKKANAAYSKIIKSYLKLKIEAESLKAVLLELIKHENESVQCWSATYLLPYCQEIGEHKLEEIANGAGVTAFDAFMTLKEWKRGTLKFPPFG